MPPANRSAGRTVHIYDANDPTAVLGGLKLTNGVTNANFYSMVDIFVIIESDYFLRDENNSKIEKDDHPFLPGNYYIVTAGSLSINDEPSLLRTISHCSGTRVSGFRDAVRARDRRCVISGDEAFEADDDYWWGFDAAHIFPLAHEGLWSELGFSRWITIPPPRGGKINSVQNGMLLDRTVHAMFDNYIISINPDDNYKVVAFAPGSRGLAGKHLDERFLSDPQRPVDQLLPWHFRQAVLANMRGAGEPIFEHDFPPGSDMVGDILTGPKASERMEYELFSRLANQTEILSPACPNLHSPSATASH